MEKKLRNLPQMSRGDGVFTWGNQNHTTYKFTKTFQSDVDGTRQRISVNAGGETEAKAKLNCLLKWEEKTRAIEEQKRKEQEAPEPELQTAMFEWLQKTKLNNQTVKARSYDREECTIKNQIAKYEFGKIPTSAVTGLDIERHIHFLQYESEKQYSHGTVKKTFEVLSQFFSWYYAESPKDNPFLLLEKPKPKRDVSEITVEEANSVLEMPEIVLTDEEIATFKEWCYKEPLPGRRGGTKYGVHLYFTLTTCLRIGEALGLVWEDVNFKTKKLRINKAYSIARNRTEGAEQKTRRILTAPKTESSRRHVFLTDEAIEALQHIKAHSKHTEPQDPIFCTDNGTIPIPQNLSEGLKGILKASGLNPDGRRDKFGLHYLRHTGISYYIRNGVPIDAVAKMAGHADATITRRTYYHIIEEQEKKALRVMNRIGKKRSTAAKKTT